MDWDAHIKAATRAGVTLSSYARQHGLSVQALYKARRRMRERESEARDARRPAEPVAPAATATPRARVWAHLPNGVSVESLCTSADVELLVAMMDSLGRTACSASTRI